MGVWGENVIFVHFGHLLKGLSNLFTQNLLQCCSKALSFTHFSLLCCQETARSKAISPHVKQHIVAQHVAAVQLTKSLCSQV